MHFTLPGSAHVHNIRVTVTQTIMHVLTIAFHATNFNVCANKSNNDEQSLASAALRHWNVCLSISNCYTQKV